MYGTPVTYSSFECIMCYMDANLRFIFARCCPSLERVEMEFPMKIRTLLIGDFLKINMTSYRFSLIREALGEGSISEYGFEYDGDNELVCYDRTGFDTMSPGSSCPRFSDYFNSEEESEENARLEASRKQMDDSPRVKGSHHILVECCYYNRVQDVHVERLAYNKTLRKAKDYLANKFLSGRCSVQVDSLQILTDELDIPPLPSKAKLRDAPSTPLESVLLASPEHFDNPVVTTAKKVVVHGLASELLIIGSEIPRVHAVGVGYKQEHLDVLLNPFTTQGRPAGTFYSVEICEPCHFEVLFEEIKKMRSSKIIEMKKTKNLECSGYAILPVNGGSERQVRCDPCEGDEGGIAVVKFQFYQKGKSRFSLSS